MPNSQNYWKDIDGKYLINYRVAGLVTPVAIMTPVLQEMHRYPGTPVLSWTVASSMGWATVAAIYALADVTVFRDRENKKYDLWVALLFGAVLGLAKGGITAASAIFMGIAEHDQVAYAYFRTLNATLIGLVGVPISAFTLKSINEYSKERSRLINDYLYLEERVQNDDSILDEMESNLSEKVDQNLSKVLVDAQQKIERGGSLEVQWEKIANTLREAAQETIRPLSHEIWKTRRREMQLSPAEFFSFAFANIKFRPALVIPLYTLTTIANLVHETHLWHPTYTMVLKDLLIWVLMEIGQIFLDLFPNQRKRALLIVLTAIGLIHFPVTELIYEATNYDRNLFNALDTFWFLTLIVLVGIADSALRTQIHQISTLKGLINEKRLELIAKGRDVDRMSREMAKYLHGTIQSKLMAAAMAVELAGRKNDYGKLDLEIERALQTLRMPSKDYLLKSGIYNLESLEEIAEKWNGILDIKISGLETAKVSEIEFRHLIDLVNEGILNAYRHGGATEIEIVVGRSKAKLIQLQIIDNGNGINTLKPGLGSELFTSITKSWELSNRQGAKGAIFTIEF